MCIYCSVVHSYEMKSYKYDCHCQIDTFVLRTKICGVDKFTIVILYSYRATTNYATEKLHS